MSYRFKKNIFYTASGTNIFINETQFRVEKWTTVCASCRSVWRQVRISVNVSDAHKLQLLTTAESQLQTGVMEQVGGMFPWTSCLWNHQWWTHENPFVVSSATSQNTGEGACTELNIDKIKHVLARYWDPLGSIHVGYTTQQFTRGV